MYKLILIFILFFLLPCLLINNNDETHIHKTTHIKTLSLNKRCFSIKPWLNYPFHISSLNYCYQPYILLFETFIIQSQTTLYLYPTSQITDWQIKGVLLRKHQMTMNGGVLMVYKQKLFLYPKTEALESRAQLAEKVVKVRWQMCGLFLDKNKRFVCCRISFFLFLM